ncbi:MAG: HlyD family secretion protein [Proteobacteria bacterium]|nr:HlyD family secretion protein [Pseudomonadota bacterium]
MTKDTSTKSRKEKAIRIAGPAILFSVGYFLYDHFFFVSTDNAQIQANTVILASRVSGFVNKVNVTEGQRVKAGDVLLEINSNDYQNRTEQSENELASLAARVRDAELNSKRVTKLFEEGAVSQQQRDSALANYQELARKQNALKNQLEISRNGLADTQIRAPSDGTIARKTAENGMLASPGTPLLGFVSSDSRWVVANFKETDLGRLKIGQKVDIAVDAVPGKAFKGEIETFYPATGAVFALLPPDNATGNFTKVVQRVPARIKLLGLSKDDIEQLRAGLSVVADVHVR